MQNANLIPHYLKCTDAILIKHQGRYREREENKTIKQMQEQANDLMKTLLRSIDRLMPDR